ncbi:hypothetical protein JZO81_03790 [Enterococcus hulanensis]|uniref:hypothetical protein n=1 Tax=Enterococcus hulanensis TaxID=2559929 RepID=UPI000B5A89ED|nr:hypothetical protein [Enterococcus hulanensis]MBO0410160.1 hypothetical protein [Enterococcus hulanensis]OTO14666.1 hypothetical protein A5875_003823 [Enterococcus sp. 3H8_DIV0648]
MILRYKKMFSDKRIYIRILVSLITFLLLFFSVASVSYFLLPEGILKETNPLSNFSTSTDLIESTIQIFLYNSISVIVMSFASLFAFSNRNDSFLSYGYLGLSTQFLINGIILGTWSFSVTNQAAPSLTMRLLRTFDLFHRSGLWEMIGQLLIVAALARISFIRSNRKEIENTPFKEIRLSKAECLTIVSGLVLMFLGAFIESYAIIYDR